MKRCLQALLLLVLAPLVQGGASRSPTTVRWSCAYFSSARTGRIQLAAFGGNLADPTGSVTIVHLDLHSPKDLATFVHIANRRGVIGHATIVENRNPHYFVIGNARVTGYRRDFPLVPYYPHGRAFVALSVAKWTAIEASWKGERATPLQSGADCI